MRMIFGVLSMLVVVAIVGLIARHQLHAVGAAGGADAAASAAGLSLPPAASSGDRSARQQARNIEQQMRDATNQALQQGAQRASDADQ